MYFNVGLLLLLQICKMVGSLKCILHMSSKELYFCISRLILLFATCFITKLTITLLKITNNITVLKCLWNFLEFTVSKIDENIQMVAFLLRNDWRTLVTQTCKGVWLYNSFYQGVLLTESKRKNPRKRKFEVEILRG